MKTVTAWLFFAAQSTQAWVIFAAVSAEISFLISVFFAASSEMTNLLMFCADKAAASATIIASVFSILVANVPFEPAFKVSGDAVAVVLEHHLMTVTRLANVLQLHIIGLDARLIQPFSIAGIEDPVIARLTGHVQHWNLRQVR